jgi:predicted permease
MKTRSRIAERIADVVSSLPGVQGATSGSDSTPHGETLLSIAGDSSTQRVSAQVATQEVATNFFSFMRIPLLRGRIFDRRDQQDTQQVAIVNQALARKFFPHIDPIGQEIKLSRADDDSVPWLTVIGVIANVKTSTVFKEMGYIEEPSVYRPLAQSAPASLALIVGAEGSPPGLVSGIQQQLFTLDRGLMLAGVETMEARQATALSPPRFRVVLFGSFAFLALVLAVVGLYGVLSQLVSRRTGEIAIRMALGADRARILRSVLRHAFTMVVAGIGLGVVGGALAVHLIRGLLYEVHAGNYAQFALASLLMLVVGLAASWLPARRASSVDPMQALRGE